SAQAPEPDLELGHEGCRSMGSRSDCLPPRFLLERCTILRCRGGLDARPLRAARRGPSREFRLIAPTRERSRRNAHSADDERHEEMAVMDAAAYGSRPIGPTKLHAHLLFSDRPQGVEKIHGVESD